MREVCRSPRCARHDFKARIEVNHRRGELLEEGDVSLCLAGPVRDLGLEFLCAHHRLLQVRAVDGQRQVRFLSEVPLDVRQGCVFQLDQELLAVVGRDEVDRESHSLGLAAVHTDGEEVQEQLRRHREDHVGAA